VVASLIACFPETQCESYPHADGAQINSTRHARAGRIGIVNGRAKPEFRSGKDAPSPRYDQTRDSQDDVMADNRHAMARNVAKQEYVAPV